MKNIITNMKTLNAKKYIDPLTGCGEISLTAQSMQDDLGITTKASERAIYQLRQKN